MLQVEKDKILPMLSNYIEYCNSYKKDILDDKNLLSIQISFKKIPIVQGYQKFYITLPFSYSKNLKTCLIVKNLEKVCPDNFQDDNWNSKVKFDEEDDLNDVDFWKTKLLKECGVSFTKIITFHQLRTIYDQFEVRNRLATSYDMFFADHRLMQYFSRTLGAPFVKRKKWPIGIKLDKMANCKGAVNTAFCKTPCLIKGQGSCCEITFAHTGMFLNEIYENLKRCIKMLDSKVPGNFTNIRNITLRSRPLNVCKPQHKHHKIIQDALAEIKINESKIPLSIPLYINIDTHAIKIPHAKKPKLEHLENAYEDITTIPDGVKVNISPNGRIAFKIVKCAQSKKNDKNINDTVINDNQAQSTGDDLADSQLKEVLSTDFHHLLSMDKEIFKHQSSNLSRKMGAQRKKFDQNKNIIKNMKGKPFNLSVNKTLESPITQILDKTEVKVEVKSELGDEIVQKTSQKLGKESQLQINNYTPGSNKDIFSTNKTVRISNKITPAKKSPNLSKICQTKNALNKSVNEELVRIIKDKKRLASTVLREQKLEIEEELLTNYAQTLNSPKNGDDVLPTIKTSNRKQLKKEDKNLNKNQVFIKSNSDAIQVKLVKQLGSSPTKTNLVEKTPKRLLNDSKENESIENGIIKRSKINSNKINKPPNSKQLHLVITPIELKNSTARRKLKQLAQQKLNAFTKNEDAAPVKNKTKTEMFIDSKFSKDLRNETKPNDVIGTPMTLRQRNKKHEPIHPTLYIAPKFKLIKSKKTNKRVCQSTPKQSMINEFIDASFSNFTGQDRVPPATKK